MWFQLVWVFSNSLELIVTSKFMFKQHRRRRIATKSICVFISSIGSLINSGRKPTNLSYCRSYACVVLYVCFECSQSSLTEDTWICTLRILISHFKIAWIFYVVCFIAYPYIFCWKKADIITINKITTQPW